MLHNQHHSLGLIIRSTKFLLEFTSLFICPALTNERFSFLAMSSHNIFYSIFEQVVFVFMSMEDSFSIIKVGLPKTMPHISNGTTSSSTSSMKFAVIANFSLHFLVTCNFALSHTHPMDMVYDVEWFQDLNS
jgi:hypothetical protein